MSVRAHRLPEALWLSLRAGQARELVREWMDRARENRRRGFGHDAVCFCVRRAREKHREYRQLLAQAVKARS